MDYQDNIAQRLAAYIPRRLEQQIRQKGLPTPGEVRRFSAATLFCDISGFTRMAEELASDGPRGAEELNRVLLLTFTAMISLIHDAGGSVGHFYGDAMTVFFPEKTGSEEADHAVRRAWICSLMMQRVMAASVSRVVTNRPGGKNPVFHLTMRIGLGYGECVELVVGNQAESLEYVVGGPAIDEAVAAEHAAEQSQVFAGAAFLRHLGLEPSAAFQQLDDSFAQNQDLLPSEWPEKGTAENGKLDKETLSRFLHPALAERLAVAGADFLAEHRPVTSMFVQFEGIDFTAEDVGNRLQLYYEWARETVARYGGSNSHLNRVLTGDKGNQLHIIFGAPVAPDSPGQAVRCALALLREKPAFITGQRIGLAVGKVFACPVGSEQRREYTVVGDVVNLSARLTEVCSANSLIIDEAALDRCRSWLEYEELPAVSLKGKQEPVPLFRAVGERLMTNRLQSHFGRWQRPMIGREDELDILIGGMEAAVRGIGGAAAISGALGIGKSRLLAEGGRYWLENGGQVLIGDSQPHTSETPFGPWLALWREFFELRPDMPEAMQAEVIAAHIKALYPEAGAEAALWGEVLGIEVEAAESFEQLPAEVRQARFFNLVRQCFQSSARSKPLLIALEDIHWADQASLDLIDALGDYLQELPIFVVVTFRPLETAPLELLNRPVCTPLVLGDLPPAGAREMVHSLLGVTELPPNVERHLGLRDRDGLSSPVNPLFLEEALRVMVENKVITVNGWVRVDENRLQQMQVPDTIHGLLLARLDGLPAASRDVLQIASVIGRQFALDILSRITPRQPQGDLVDLLNGLSVAEMVQLIHADPELTYLFQHAMTQEVAYESLPYARRQTLHAAIADWLVERYGDNLRPFYPMLAYHYSQTDIHEKGLEYALAAADDARDIYANREAVELYKLAEAHLKALGVDGWWQTAVQLYLSRGEVNKLLGDFAAATMDAESALAQLEKDGRSGNKAVACNLLAEIRYRQGNYSEAKALADSVISATAGQRFSPEMARAHTWHGMAAAALLEYDHAVHHLKKAEEISLAIDDAQRLSGVLEALAYIHYSRQELDLALEVMQRGVVIKRDFATPANYGIALNNVALIQSSLGLVEEALETLNRAAAIAEDTSRNVFAIVLSNRAEMLAYVGRFEDAERDFRKAVNLFAGMDDAYSQAMTHLLWGYEYCLVLQRWEEAQFHFDQSCRIFDFQSENYPEERARLLIGLGCLEIAVGTAEGANSLFHSALEIIREKELNWWKPAVYYFLGLICLHNRETGTAQDYFREAVETAAQRGCPDYLPLALLGLALAENEPETRAGYLRDCIEAAEKRTRFNDRIYCLKTAGELLAQLAVNGKQ